MTRTHFAAAMLSVSLLAPQARGESHPTAADGSRVETLKAAYLACDRETSSHPWTRRPRAGAWTSAAN